jgi:hypothetical protein
MGFDMEIMKQLAWELFRCTDKLRFVGYEMTKDKDRAKGQYTIHELVSYGDYKALRTDLSEMDERQIGNALFHISELRQCMNEVSKGLDYFEEQLRKAP